MEVRGFDSYDISLGDEMRGERASLGKSLEDVERDLRIKVKMLDAIENCDLTGFTNQSVIAGYVRSYSKYLGMNPDDCYARFCAESGYRSPGAMMSQSGISTGLGSTLGEAAPMRGGLAISDSRFAAPPSRNRFQARISLGAITSALALIALIAGLSYGGYALLQDIQRVGFAPLPEAPTVVADAPRIDAPVLTTTKDDDRRPDASAYAGGGTLAAIRSPSDLSPGPRPRRDGPISAIDPRHASLFARAAPAEPAGAAFADASTDAATRAARNEFRAEPTARAGTTTALGGDITTDAAPRIARVDASPEVGRLATGPIVARRDTAAAIAGRGTATGPGPASATEDRVETPASSERGISLLASGEAWMEVRDRDNAIVFSGILKPGQEVRLPEQILAPKIHLGNAGASYLIIDGVAYGPFGSRGAVRRNFALTAENIRSELPQTDLMALRSGDGDAKVIEVAPVARADEKIVLPPRRPNR